MCCECTRFLNACGDESLSSPLVSVIMPNYNGARFVERAIWSVLRQTYRHFELIVVDDCSTDISPEIIRELASKDCRIKLINCNKNNGVANARNIGIRNSKGDYIALLDNDDIWETDKLERQLAMSQTGADIVYCSYDFIDENDQPIKKPFIVPESATFYSMLGLNVISCSTAFIRAELLKSHLFSSEFYHEDYALWMELLKLPVEAKGDKKVLMHYRQVAGSRSNRKGNAAKERWRIYRRALGLNVIQSIWVFVRYVVNGVIKYYL